MLNGKVCIKRQGHLELHFSREKRHWEERGQEAFRWRLIGSLCGRMLDVSSYFQPGVLILILMEIWTELWGVYISFSLWLGSHGFGLQEESGCAWWLCNLFCYPCSASLSPLWFSTSFISPFLCMKALSHHREVHLQLKLPKWPIMFIKTEKRKKGRKKERRLQFVSAVWRTALLWMMATEPHLSFLSSFFFFFLAFCLFLGCSFGFLGFPP